VYSVFHYFPSHEYADHALKEQFRVCRDNGRIWIGDVPDKSKRQEALLRRDQLMKQSTPKWPWPNVGLLEHRFYDEEFFATFCKGIGCKYGFEQQDVDGYVQGEYRFNVFIEK
jgi:hypothetical protein